MSVIVNWIAAEGLEPALLLEELGLRQVGAANDHREGRCAYSFTRKGWLLLASKAKVHDQLLPRLAAQRPLAAGEVHSIVNYSKVEVWNAGTRLWSATHNPEEGLRGLEITGEPPREFLQIRERYLAWQAEEGAGVDCVFEAVLEMSDWLCGYRPDEPAPGPWMLLEPVKGAAGPALSALPDAIRGELWPALAEFGWTLAPIRLRSTGRAYDASRVRHGRLEVLRFLWRDNRRDLEIVPSYAIVDGDHPGDRLLVSAGIGQDPPSFLQRMRSALLRGGKAESSYEEKVREVIAKQRADWPSLDRIISEDAVRLLAGGAETVT